MQDGFISLLPIIMMSNLKKKAEGTPTTTLGAANEKLRTMCASSTRRHRSCAKAIPTLGRRVTVSSGSSVSEAEVQSPPSPDNPGTHESGLDSMSMLSSLGGEPSPSELAEVVAVRAKEYIDECLFDSSGALDRQRWESIPQCCKSDLSIGKYLGRGSFSDVFEVRVTVVEPRENGLNSPERGELPAEVMYEEGEVNDDVDAQSDALFADEGNSKKRDQQEKNKQAKQTPKPGKIFSSSSHDERPSGGPRPTDLLHQSVCVSAPIKKKEAAYAMKTLRPKVRSSPYLFLHGVDDLVHETAVLASLRHPNIIGLHGRAGDAGSPDFFRLNDGYFILLDRLTDTLEARIASWKKISAREGRRGRRGAAPTSGQLQAACSVTDALSYLHSKRILFRDLKPANVGYDARGTVKLFDFGLATLVAADGHDGGRSVCRACGTLRYMAPECGLGAAYSFPVDVYSFGVLLWEICSLERPFARIKSPEDFRRVVFEGGARPKLAKRWPPVLKGIIGRCWCSKPGKRPTMKEVKLC